MAKKSVEEIKAESAGLRGRIVDALNDPKATHLEEEEHQLLKFHGVYEGDDRDQRKDRRAQGLDRAWNYMVRTKLPGGETTAKQYLELDRMAEDLGAAPLRITSRQDIQFHGILKGTLKELMRRIYECGLTTWGGCGDVVRNVMATAAPLDTPAHREMQRLAREVSDVFLARSGAYMEIWVDGKRINPKATSMSEIWAPTPEEEDQTEEEPIYGKQYLPRKFKIAVALPPRNDIDIYSHDLGFAAHAPKGEIQGYTVLVGGGHGMSHGKLDTFPALAKPLFYVRKEDAVETAIAVVTAQRDFGNREDRKRARLKYVLEERGLDWFRDEVKSRMKAETFPPKQLRWNTMMDPLGWNDQGDGRLFYGLRIENGRIKDSERANWRSGLRALLERFDCPIRLSANHNVMLANLLPEDQPEFEEILAEHHIPGPDSYTMARRFSMACVALPTCGLALAEGERVFEDVMDGIDKLLKEFGLENEEILFRMTGCPNGCVRPYNADFAFVGRAPGKYAMYVGGSHRGEEMSALEYRSIDLEEIPKRVRPYLEEYSWKRRDGESFGDYWRRTRRREEGPYAHQFHLAPDVPVDVNPYTVGL